mmetsp:Transcript_49135/g.139167  ORF Transcript_49135/g.139167 Transcript_49135/m.139167 type:complete len:1351 (-) Transcript_49135:2919-6971(-)
MGRNTVYHEVGLPDRGELLLEDLALHVVHLLVRRDQAPRSRLRAVEGEVGGRRLDVGPLEPLDLLLEEVLLLRHPRQHELGLAPLRRRVARLDEPLLDHLRTLRVAQRRAVLCDLVAQLELREAPLEPVVEVAARRLPRDLLHDHARRRHASGAVVEVGELHRNLLVDAHDKGLALGDLRRDVRALRLVELVGRGRVGARVGRELGVELLEHGVEAVGGGRQVLLAVLDRGDRVRLEHAAARVVRREELHHVRVDGRVDHDPRAAAQLGEGRDVDEDRLLERDERVDDLGAKLEDLVEHVALAAREAAPVGEDHARQVLRVEVVDGLRGLVGRVREPDAARLEGVLLHRGRVGRVGRGEGLDGAVLGDDDAHGDAAEARAAAHDGLGPPVEGLGERRLVEEAGDPLAVHLRVLAADEVPRVIRDALGLGAPLHGPVDQVDAGDVGDGQRHAAHRRHVREPVDRREHRVQVVVHEKVRDAVREHDHGAAQLVVRGVDILAHELVQGLVSGEDDRRVGALLDGALAEADEVGADADRAASDEGEGEDVLVRAARLAGDHARAAEVLHAKVRLLADHVRQHPPLLLALEHALALDGRHLADAKLLVVGRGEVEVLEALRRVLGVVPRDLERVADGLGQADARARVGGEVEARDLARAGHLGGGLEDAVLAGAERALDVGDVVRDEDHVAARRILWSAEGAEPRHHADVVLARGARGRRELTVARLEVLKGPAVRAGAEAARLELDHELNGREDLGRTALGRLGLGLGHGLVVVPGDLNGLGEELKVVEAVERVRRVEGRGALALKRTDELVRELNVLAVPDARLGRVERLEDGGRALVLLDVGLGLEHIAGRVRREDAERHGRRLLAEAAHDLELEVRHAEAGELVRVAGHEGRGDLLHRGGGDHRVGGNDVEEEVVRGERRRGLLGLGRVYLLVLGHLELEGVERLDEEALGLGLLVLRGNGHHAHEEALEKRPLEAGLGSERLLGHGRVHVYVTHLRLERVRVLDVEVRQAEQVELERVRRLDVAEEGVLAEVVLKAEGEDRRQVGDVAVDVDHEGHAAYALCLKRVSEPSEEGRREGREGLLVAVALKDHRRVKARDVNRVDGLGVLALRGRDLGDDGAEVGGELLPAGALDEHALARDARRNARVDGALDVRLHVGRHLGKVHGRWRARGLHCAIRTAHEGEADERHLVLHGTAAERDEVVGDVGLPNVELKRRELHGIIVVADEVREHVTDRDVGLHEVLHLLHALREADHRGAGEHIAEGSGELAAALLKRRKVLLNEKLTSLEGHHTVLLVGEGAELGKDRVEEAHVHGAAHGVELEKGGERGGRGALLARHATGRRLRGGDDAAR